MAAHAELIEDSERKESQLSASITKKTLLLFIVGDILGGGHLRPDGRGRRGRSAARSGPASRSRRSIAAFTAASYAELVTKYPQAAGAALYVHKAFKRAAPDVRRRVRGDVLRRWRRAAALATAFGGDYLSEFVELPTVLVGLVVIAGVSADQLPRDQGVGRLQRRAAR